MPRQRQRGVALLLLVAMLAMGSTWYLLSRVHELSANRTAADRAYNARVLSQARQALIGYVAAQANKGGGNPENNPGRLPCPEAAGYFDSTTQDGTSAGSCTLPKVGRFPWRTIGTDKLVDAAGEPLWYVVGANWAYTGSNTVINSNTTGQLTVDSVANDSVALIIAPGPAITVTASTNCTAYVQTRPTSGNPDLRNYLECENATNPADNTFVTSGPSGSFNDQLVKVTAADLLPGIEAGVAHRFQRDIASQIKTAYSSGLWAATPALPFAVSFSDPTASPGNKFQGAAVVSTGTVAVTNGSTTATLSSAPTVSYAGRMFHVQGATTYYRISSHTANTTAMTLSTAYAETTSGAASYHVFVPEGLFPASYATTGGCSPGPCTPTACDTTDARCDPSFVAWASATLARTGGALLGSYSCSVSGSPTTLSCTIYVYESTNSNTWMTFTLSPIASNVGMALRQINATVPFTGVDTANLNSPYGYSVTAGTLNTAGSATLTISSRVPAAGGTSVGVSLPLCGFVSWFFSYTCYRHTITLPMFLLADHPVVDPSNSTYNWFFRNKWHEVSYYAVAPNISPAGTRSCVTSSTCLQLAYHRDSSGANDEGKPRGLLVIGGRQLSGQNRPATVVTDLLEGANADGTSPFEVRSATLLTNRSFNDRFAVIDSN